MSRRRHTPEQIITALREAEVGLANGKTVAMVSRELGTAKTYSGRSSGGSRASRSRTAEGAVANLTVDKLILEEATKGNF